MYRPIFYRHRAWGARARPDDLQKEGAAERHIGTANLFYYIKIFVENITFQCYNLPFRYCIGSQGAKTRILRYFTQREVE